MNQYDSSFQTMITKQENSYLSRRWKDKALNHLAFDPVLEIAIAYLINLAPGKKDFALQNIFCNFPGIQSLKAFH